MDQICFLKPLSSDNHRIWAKVLLQCVTKVWYSSKGWLVIGLVRQARMTLGWGSPSPWLAGTNALWSWTRLVALANVDSWMAGSSFAAFTTEMYRSTLESPIRCSLNMIKMFGRWSRNRGLPLTSRPFIVVYAGNFSTCLNWLGWYLQTHTRSHTETHTHTQNCNTQKKQELEK